MNLNIEAGSPDMQAATARARQLLHASRTEVGATYGMEFTEVSHELDDLSAALHLIAALTGIAHTAVLALIGTRAEDEPFEDAVDAVIETAQNHGII